MVPDYNKIQFPAHLKKYVVSQDYGRYTPEDQAVWRYILRRLTNYLSQKAHPCYLEGMERSGISIESIPRIEDMNSRLAEFGWGAVSVSGFIPPAAFMEFQSLGLLPIACDMRSIDHLLYTPAPDIVHEAAGHAPMLVDPAYARYLRRYAEIASKAIISKEDLAQYEAIRILSDCKENPDSEPSDIAEALEKLNEATLAISYVSEAAYLGRMNWWTAEYGLIGDLGEPKIFGAGLLSSLGESLTCLEEKIPKLPLTLHCLDYPYDITEPQPQLFVTPSFEVLENVLRKLGSQMAFKQGGLIGLEKALAAKTVNTIELNSGLQISGILSSYHSAQVAGLIEPIFFSFKGPTQLCLQGSQLDGHGTDYHSEGFSSPVGLLKNENRCLSVMDSQDLQRLGLVVDSTATLCFASGIIVIGLVRKIVRKNGQIILIGFDQCTVKRGDEFLFKPEWGVFDLGVGSLIASVFGGPADRIRHGTLDDFVAKRVQHRIYSPEQITAFSLYQEIRNVRLNVNDSISESESAMKLVKTYFDSFRQHWLMGVELLELSLALKLSETTHHLESHLKNNFNGFSSDVRDCIQVGIRLAREIGIPARLKSRLE
ncbi:MAG: aromatic amino acid hydroxylase [Bdellovibrionales bacterium]|nr:aromatic amino acid hydroxylase [Bdellovibrionales bacterium]